MNNFKHFKQISPPQDDFSRDVRLGTVFNPLTVMIITNTSRGTNQSVVASLFWTFSNVNLSFENLGFP